VQEQSGSSAAMLIVLLVVGLAVAAAIILWARRRGSGASARPVREGQPISRSTSSGLADDLSALADLRDKGILSSQEFEVEKAKLLRSGS
jgi:Short C-terminal domain